MIMMMITSNGFDDPTSIHPITPNWKLYHNPFFFSHQKLNPNNIHWDVKFMDTQLDRAKAQIIELKAELDFERKIRKKTENVNKKLIREVSEERQGREMLERVCQQLENKVSATKSEMSKVKKEIDQERKMLRIAEVFREERVQMKLTDAKFFLEDKILELEQTKWNQNHTNILKNENENENNPPKSNYFLDEKLVSCNSDHNEAGVTNSVLVHQRKPSPEPENPHIKRGIKGFVEFPRVVRAMGSKNRHLGTKFECQKAQFNLLLKQKCPVRSSNLIIS